MNLTRFYQIDSDSRHRAQFAVGAAAIAVHAEPFDTIEELIAFGATDGVVFVEDGGRQLAACLAAIEEAGLWFPVIGYRESPTAADVVDAIHLGAADYLAWPIAPSVLSSRLASVARWTREVESFARRKADAVFQVNRLSPRERELLALVGHGHSNKSAAQVMGISPRTVEIHRANLREKIGAQTAAEVVRYAIDAGIVDRPLGVSRFSALAFRLQ